MNNEHITRFGFPTSPHGALYIMDDKEGIIQFYADICRTVLRLKGVEITPTIETQILEFCRRKQDEYDKEVDAEGVPDKLRTLFDIERKSEAVRYCKNLELSEYELFLLVHNSSQMGFTHRAKFTEFVPQHLKISNSDISNLKDSAPRQFLKKIDGIFLERRRIHVHLFERVDQWHCFYYSYSDIESDSKSHWKYGSHLHYVSYLWPNCQKGKIWASFDERSTDISGNVHIRLIPFPIANDSYRGE